MQHRRQQVRLPPRAIAASGTSAPTQYATATPCTNSDGTVSHSGGAVAACPLVASESPTPSIAAAVSTQAIVIVGLRHATRAMAIAAIAISSDGPRLVPSALVHGADVTSAVERKIEQIEALQAQRDHRADQADGKRAEDHPFAAAGPGAIQAAKNTPPTPTNSPR